MNSLDVQIIKLEPMRVASAYAFGTGPEEEAWEKLVAWAQPRGLLDNIDEHPIFGFNNPNPISESSKYGYEVWIKVPIEIEPEGEIRVIEFMGGPYAVARCEALGKPYENIPATWQSLVEWCQKNSHKLGYHQALERFIAGIDSPDNLVLDLYCPIIE